MLWQRLAEALLDAAEELDLDVDAAWIDEIRHRIAEIDSGTAKLIPAEEVFTEMRRLLR
jgi:Putative addiction module component